MAEFKIAEGLDSEILGVQNVALAVAVTPSAASAEGLSLPTSTMYVEQHERIAALLTEYRGLVLKDVKDLQAMVNNVRAVDQTIASNT